MSLSSIDRLPRVFGATRRLSWVIALTLAGIALGCGSDDTGSATQGDNGTGGLLSVGAAGGTDSGNGNGGSQQGSGGATSTGGRSRGAGGATTSSGGKKASGGSKSSGGSTSDGGSTSSGGASSGGAMSSGGTTSSGGRAQGGATGQPVGSICVNDANCSQSGGMAVCCAIPGCSGPCECRLTAQCPKGNLFLECMTAKDCTAYGGGKVCCEAGSGASTMRYCTKPSGCTGTVLP